MRFIPVVLAFAAVSVGAQTPAAPAQAKTAAAYKMEVPAKLLKKAKVTEAAAAASALAKVPGGKIESVELEEEDGKLIFSYDIKVAGKSGIEEIHVDAGTGLVVKSEHESPAAMKAEAEKDEKEAKDAKAAMAPAKTKKPPTR